MPGGIYGLVVLALFVLLSSVGLAAAAVMASVMWPGAVARCDGALRAQPLRCWLCGLLIVLAEVWLAAVLLPVRIGVLAAALLANLVLLGRGVPALAGLVGDRLGIAVRPRAVAAGAVLLALCGALPFVGWALAATLLVQALGSAALPAGRAPAPLPEPVPVSAAPADVAP